MSEKGRKSSGIDHRELDLLLQRGFDWLSKHITETIYQVSGTTISLAMIAYCSYDYPKHRTDIDILRTRLLSLQKGKDGSWNNELWDTAWAILALSTEHFCSVRKTLSPMIPPIRNALAFIEDTKTVRDNWQGELNESIVTALALLKINHLREYPFVQKAIRWIIGKQSQQGCWTDVYDTCLAVRLVTEAQKCASSLLNDSDEGRIKEAVGWLRNINPREENVWINSNLLLCLVDVGIGAGDPLILDLYKWFQEKEAEGCWSSYEDEQAYALIALAKLREKLPRPFPTKRARSSVLPKGSNLNNRVATDLKNMKLGNIGENIKINGVVFDFMAEGGNILRPKFTVVRTFKGMLKPKDVEGFFMDIKKAKETQREVSEGWICARGFSPRARVLVDNAKSEMEKLGIRIKLREY